MIKNLFKYLIAICGIALFFWLRFIRERLPRDIPFSLSVISLCSLIFLCFIYLQLLLKMYKKPKPMPLFIENILLFLLKFQKIFLDLFTLFLNNKLIINYVITLAKDLEHSIEYSLDYYYKFIIMPQVILLSIFWFDIFYFHKLELFYYFIFLSLLILFNKYLIVAFKITKELLIQKLESYLYDGTIILHLSPEVLSLYEFVSNKDVMSESTIDWGYLPETFVAPLRIYLNFFITDELYPLNLKTPSKIYIFRESEHYRDYYIEYQEKKGLNRRDYILTKKFQEQRHKDLEYLLHNILYLEYLIFTYDSIYNYNKKIKLFKTLIYLNNLICWLYIIIVCLPFVFFYDLSYFWFFIDYYKFEILLKAYSLINSKFAILSVLFFMYYITKKNI